ncbi:MAG: FAD-dependent oxidoreductase [Clostridiaceae bacterium]|jgi:NAD(P)H-nitrite reductase large subunit|nr:FAD-dependent oxidoreductase [Clostridiaceae bacterium]
MKNYILIGNSAAAVGCAEGIRSLDGVDKITFISDELHHTYSRPLISYMLQGKIRREKMTYRDADFYKVSNAEFIAGVRVERILPNENEILLSNGKTLSYDDLLVATGSRAFVPPIDGLDTVKDKFTFMSLDDALSLEAVLSKEKTVLIVGAGLIGLKCAEGVAERVGQVVVTDIAERVLPSILDKNSSETVKKHLEQNKVKFILNDQIRLLEANKAYFKGGAEVGFDILVVASGVRPNTELVSAAGGAVERGIVVDDYMKTTLPHVYAAGDCTLSYDISAGQKKILALLPNAYMQGFVAGLNMSGGEKKYENAIPMNSIGFFGLHIVSAGSYTGEEHVVKTPHGSKRFYVKDNLLKGYINIGDIERSGIYTALIRETVPLDTIDFEMIKQRPQLMAFDRQRRASLLSGR